MVFDDRQQRTMTLKTAGSGGEVRGPPPRGTWWSTAPRASPPDMSFLEMLDVVNERLTRSGEEPIAFDHDCREGICGPAG